MRGAAATVLTRPATPGGWHRRCSERQELPGRPAVERMNARSSHLGIAAAALTLALAGDARADALFASPPHFVAEGARRQLIFFLNEAVSGALASRTGDRAIEVLVPRSAVDPSIAGE